MRKRDKIKEESELIYYSVSLGFILGIVIMTLVNHYGFTKNSVLIDNGIAEYNRTTGVLEIIKKKGD